MARRISILRWLGIALAILVLATLSLWLQQSNDVPITRASYDYLHALAQPWTPSLSNSPVVIVYLDVESYRAEKQHLDEPWSRTLHAQLVRRLTAAGASAIAFDIIFSENGPPAATRDFAAAIRGSGRVVLAAELNRSSRESSDASATTQILTLPQAELRESAAAIGLANLIADDDFVVRRYYAGSRLQEMPSLAEAVARRLHFRTSTNQSAASRWLRYYDRAASLPNVSCTHALHSASAPDSFFKDKIVFVGARPITAGFAERRDEFRSPFPSWRRELFMPAVEVHATQMLNLMRNDSLRRLPLGTESLLLVVTAMAIGCGLFALRPLSATVAALGASGMAALAAGASFTVGHVWFPWLIVAGVQVPFALGASVLWQSLDWYRTRRRLEGQRRSAERKVREQAALIDKAQDAILLQDLNHQIIYANASATRLFGWPNSQLGEPGASAQIFAPCAGQIPGIKKILHERREWQGQLELATRTGQRLLVDSRWTLILDDFGQPSSVLLINTDVTERKQLEAQILRTQRMEAVWSIAGGMAHDLNNALSPVILGIQRLRARVPDVDLRRTLSVMEANTHRSAEMIRQVLAFSRGQGDRRELMNPGQILHEIERIALHTFPKAIEISALVPPDLWPVYANSTQLHQVLLNLSVNARDAMTAGGELTFAADNVTFSPAEAAEMPGGSPGDFVMLLVADTGSGIPPDVLPRIFEPFFTTKADGEGTGLGLSTSARLIKSHGGFIFVKTEFGIGSTFEVYLPRAISPSSTLDTPRRLPPRGNNEMILIVDDEVTVCDLLRASLEDAGYRTITAADGAKALALLPKHSVQLAVVDYSMPITNGLATISAFRQIKPDLPCILMSGDRLPEGQKGACHTNAYIAKPFPIEHLLDLIHLQLRSSPAR